MAVPTDLGLTTGLPESSRKSEEGAGWRGCAGPGSWAQDVPAGTKSLSWLRPSTLWQSRNDFIAKLIADPTNVARARWVELARRRAQRTGAHPDFVISRAAGDAVSVLVIGDTGEGDNSQYAIAGSLLETSKDADFAIICSDVVYPTGEMDDYGRMFHHPFRNLELPIYAIPGNHDWYDGLHGFMHYFCKLDDPGYLPQFGRRPAAGLAKLLWRRSPYPGAQKKSSTDGVVIEERPRPNPLQPAPYFAIDAGPVRFIGIDTGITGEVDEHQYDWLKRVSLDAPHRPKILLTGKPIYVDGEHHPGRVSGTTETIDDVVTDPRTNYVLAIGGDIHNYQRYPVPVPGPRTIQYVVSGGGGAYMHATHRIPLVDVNGVDESTFRCYPLRRDSLARFSQVIDKKLFGGSGTVAIDAPAAGRYYEQRGVTTARSKRPVADRLAPTERIKAALVQRVPAGRVFHRVGSEVFDFDEPPFFKQFLRIDANQSEITVTCFGVTGCADSEHAPPIEDQVTISLKQPGAEFAGAP
ncbi:MAG: metallophosphoesterase [Actinomycetota bacterium]|nr:metallophosphoesterase [Actinomycetota bacterium]